MSEQNPNPEKSQEHNTPQNKKGLLEFAKKIGSPRLQIILFILTLVSTTIAGAEWRFGRYFLSGNLTWDELLQGLHYSLPFLLALTVHEFGHYFTAMYHKVRVTLPYYIPLPFALGTMGALIAIKDKNQTRKQFFDIGIAGPLAGFVVALGILYYGFTHLPDKETFVGEIHPEYAYFEVQNSEYLPKTDTFIVASEFKSKIGYIPTQWGDRDTVRYSFSHGASLYFGSNILFWLFEHYVATDQKNLPDKYEAIQYPYLFAGFLALVFTALNMIPIGQLDGGHVVYGLLGHERANRLSKTFLFILALYSGWGVITPKSVNLIFEHGFGAFNTIFNIWLYYILINGCFRSLAKDKTNRLFLIVIVIGIQFFASLLFPQFEGYFGYMLFAFILGRFLGVNHPKAKEDVPLDLKRQILGWMALIIFMLCFSPKFLVMEI